MPFGEIEKYKSLAFFARQVVEGYITGMHKSPFHGFSVEFAEHRLYNTGESTRNIDWKLYARTDKLFVKRFEEETNLRCMLMIDNSSSMFFPRERQGDFRNPNKLTFSVYAAAVLVELFVRQRDAFGLTLFSSAVDMQTPVRSNEVHQNYVLSLLQNVLEEKHDDRAEKRTTDISQALHMVAEQMKRRSLVVLFTDAFQSDGKRDALFDALRHLRHARHEVILFHTYDRSREVELSFDNKPYHFIDMETDRHVKLFPAEAAQLYRQRTWQRFEELRSRAMQYRIDYVPVDINMGFDQVMQPYIIKRSRHF